MSHRCDLETPSSFASSARLRLSASRRPASAAPRVNGPPMRDSRCLAASRRVVPIAFLVVMLVDLQFDAHVPERTPHRGTIKPVCRMRSCPVWLGVDRGQCLEVGMLATHSFSVGVALFLGARCVQEVVHQHVVAALAPSLPTALQRLVIEGMPTRATLVMRAQYHHERNYQCRLTVQNGTSSVLCGGSPSSGPPSSFAPSLTTSTVLATMSP